MIEDGAIDGVDEIYGLHVWNYQKSGTIGVKSGPVSTQKLTIYSSSSRRKNNG